MRTNALSRHPITIDKPMVLIPIEEYEELLAEAGYKTTPHLTSQIREARANFKKGKTIQWETFKRELK